MLFASVTIAALTSVMAMLTMADRLPYHEICGTYTNGVGYSVPCGSCFCTKNNVPVCQRRISLECPLSIIESNQFPNKCGESNLGKPLLDGCNYLRCGNKPGGGATSTKIGCHDPKNTCAGKGPGTLFQETRCRKCVCTASGIPFCVDRCNKTADPYYPNPRVRYCSRYSAGNGFFDRGTCQTCICDERNNPVCRQPNRYTSYPENWRRKCVPRRGALLQNVCGTSNRGKVYFDGANKCKCGLTSTWPQKCFTRVSVWRDPECRNRHVGQRANIGKLCVCTISGTRFCKR